MCVCVVDSDVHIFSYALRQHSEQNHKMDESDVHIFSRALKQYSEQMETTFERGFKKIFFTHLHPVWFSSHSRSRHIKG